MIQKVCTLHSASSTQCYSILTQTDILVCVSIRKKNRNETNSSYHQFDNYWGIGLIRCLMAIHSEPRAFQYPSANEYTKLNSEFLDNILYQVTRNKGLASLGLSHAPFPLNDLLLDSSYWWVLRSKAICCLVCDYSGQWRQKIIPIVTLQ